MRSMTKLLPIHFIFLLAGVLTVSAFAADEPDYLIEGRKKGLWREVKEAPPTPEIKNKREVFYVDLEKFGIKAGFPQKQDEVIDGETIRCYPDAAYYQALANVKGINAAIAKGVASGAKWIVFPKAEGLVKAQLLAAVVKKRKADANGVSHPIPIGQLGLRKIGRSLGDQHHGRCLKSVLRSFFKVHDTLSPRKGIRDDILAASLGIAVDVAVTPGALHRLDLADVHASVQQFGKNDPLHKISSKKSRFVQ